MNEWAELSDVEVIKRTLQISGNELFEGNYYFNPVSEEAFHSAEDVYDIALASDLIEQNIGDFNNVSYVKGLVDYADYPDEKLIRIEGFDDGTCLLIEIWHFDDGDGYGASVSELVENWKELI